MEGLNSMKSHEKKACILQRRKQISIILRKFNHEENPKEYTKNLLELMYSFSKISRSICLTDARHREGIIVEIKQETRNKQKHL